MKFEWTGLYAEALTTFQADGSLDLVAFQLQIEALIQAGAAGIVVASDWGEGDALTDIEKYTLIVAATDQCRVRVPVIVAVMVPNFPQGVAFVREADTAGADGFLLYPPTGRQLTEEDKLKFYEAVTTSTSVPTMLIETPEFRLRHSFLEALSGIPQIKAVAEQGREVSSAKGRFKVFAGTSNSPARRIQAGADGWLAGGCTIFPEVAKALYNLAKAGNPRAAELENWYNLLLTQPPYPAGVQIAKCIRAEMGKNNDQVRPPRSRLSGEERTQIVDLARQMLASLPRLA